MVVSVVLIMVGFGCGLLIGVRWIVLSWIEWIVGVMVGCENCSVVGMVVVGVVFNSEIWIMCCILFMFVSVKFVLVYVVVI